MIYAVYDKYFNVTSGSNVESVAHSDKPTEINLFIWFLATLIAPISFVFSCNRQMFCFVCKQHTHAQLVTSLLLPSGFGDTKLKLQGE